VTSWPDRDSIIHSRLIDCRSLLLLYQRFLGLRSLNAKERKKHKQQLSQSPNFSISCVCYTEPSYWQLMVKKLQALRLKVSVKYVTEHCQSFHIPLQIQISTLSDSMLTGKGKCPISESRGVSSLCDLLPSRKDALFTRSRKDTVCFGKAVLFLWGIPIFMRKSYFYKALYFLEPSYQNPSS